MIPVVLLVLSFLPEPLLAEPEPLPVLVRTNKDAYTKKDHIVVTLENRASTPTWVAPFLVIDRGQGDGTYVAVYKLRVTPKCPKKPPEKNRCVRLEPKQKLTLAPWDWNTGGYDQCPPRRPGHRAFKGVHRIIATECTERLKSPPRSRTKLVTWE